MKASIVRPRIIKAAGNMAKTIEEYVGRLATESAALSVARMISPSGWEEPAQTPEFDEYSVVLRGELHAHLADGTLIARAGEALAVPSGVRVRYGTPGPEGAEYLAVCLPAFSPDLVHREPEQNAEGSEVADGKDTIVTKTDPWAPPDQHPRLPEAYDELSLWSAPFGLTLLDQVRMRRGIDALDIGCGTGFPVIELAQRLGRESRIVGLDPSPAALARTRFKLDVKGVRNVRLIEGRAESIPLDGQSIDLIVSNNGLNNVEDIERALAECARVSRPGAQMVFTFNLPESMTELYETLEKVLAERGAEEEIARMHKHIFSKRKPVDWMLDRVERAGFTDCRIIEQSFSWRFSSAQALFEHNFFRWAFIPSWIELVDEKDRPAVFGELAERLDALAAAAGGLSLTIPYACFDCRR